jgi:aminoglycoside 2''-phosphotransferase
MKKKSFSGKVEIVPSLVRRIRTEFPGLTWKTCRFINHGFDHYVLILDNKLVFRFPKRISRERPNEFSDEIRLLKYLGTRLKTPIPEYSYVARDRSFAGYKIIPGRELTESLFRKLTNADRLSLARQLADFIARLHGTPKRAIKRYHVRFKDYKDGYSDLVRKINKYIFPRLGKRDKQVVKEYLVELKSTLNHKFSRTLINSDLLGEHILWDKISRRVGIIDFSDRVYGDPAHDFAGLLNYGTEFTKRVMELYGGEKDEHMFHRVNLYHKRIPLYIMMDAHRGFPCTFKQGYDLFRRRFLK